MDRLAKEGPRVHTIVGRTEIELGNSYTALCGIEWLPTITDPNELDKLPICYDCIEVRAVTALRDFRIFMEAMQEYDRGYSDSDN